MAVYSRQMAGDNSRELSRLKRNLIRALQEDVTEKQRTVLQLRDVEEKSYKEIAEVMGITEEQVKVNLFRARQKVKQQFMNIENYGL